MQPTFHRYRWSPFLLATILAAGTVVAWVFVFQLVGSALFKRVEPYETLQFSTDGRAVLHSTVTTPYLRTVYRTLDGRELADADTIDVQSQHIPLPGRADLNGLSWTNLVRGFGEAHPVPTFWYLVHDPEGKEPSYFVGYDAKTRRRVGYIGLKGFTAELPPTEDRFQVDPRLFDLGSFANRTSSQGHQPGVSASSAPVVYVVSNQTLLAIELERRTVTPVVLSGKVQWVADFQNPLIVPDERHVIFRHKIAVRLDDRLLITDDKLAVERTITIPPAIRDLDLTFYTTTGPEVVLVGSRGRRKTQEIFWIDGEDKVVRTAVFREPLQDPRQLSWAAAMIVPVPVLVAANELVLEPWGDTRSGDMPDFRAAATQALSEAWPSLLTLTLLSAVLAVVGYRRQLRYGEPGAVAWAVFILLAGLPGFIGYLLHRRWPVVAHCETCGAMVPRNRLACLACAREFPAPARIGIELYA